MSLEPDRNEIEIFVDAMFRHAGAEGYVSVRAFLDNNEVSRISTAKLVGGLRHLIDVAEDDARRAANEAKPVVFCPPLAVFNGAEGWRARQEDLLKGLVLSVECDQRPDEALNQLEEIVGPATLVVKSGGQWIDPDDQPRDKLHLHWRLNRPAMGDRLAVLKQARSLAAAIVGGDPSNVPTVHCLRWPGSWHRKDKPRLCTIARAAPDAEIDLDEALERLAAAAPKPHESNGGAAEASTNAQPWGEFAANIVAGTKLHESLTRLAAKYASSGTSKNAGINQAEALMSVSSARHDRPAEWKARFDDIPRSFDTAYDKYAKPPLDHTRGAPPVGETIPQWSSPGPSREKLLLSAWLTRKMPLRDFLMGNVFCTTSRWLIFGDTGVGKTLFALSLAAAMTAARAFLGWDGKRRARGIYLDGEMPGETFKERMQHVADEFGDDLTLYGYNRDVLDPGEMPPLNTPEGEAWLMREIETVKPDFIVFDSVMSLLIGTMGEEESWAPAKLLARRITSKRIGQVWLHHTGHDTSKSFGTKTREWEMDTVVKLTTDDQAVQMEFKKARLRTPQNGEQFEQQTIVKDENGWRAIGGKDAEARAATSANAMTRLLLAVEADPDGTVDAWAKAADLNRSKAYRVLSIDLAREKFVLNTLGKWTLTKAGRAALKSVSGGEMAFHFVSRNAE
jgi:hypothetical protein